MVKFFVIKTQPGLTCFPLPTSFSDDFVLSQDGPDKRPRRRGFLNRQAKILAGLRFQLELVKLPLQSLKFSVRKIFQIDKLITRALFRMN